LALVAPDFAAAQRHEHLLGPEVAQPDAREQPTDRAARNAADIGDRSIEIIAQVDEVAIGEKMDIGRVSKSGV
jgi:hypothetical protein